MLKRLTAILLVVFLCIPQVVLAGYGQPTEWALYVNGEKQEIEAFAEITDFRLETRFKYVPIAAIAGYETTYIAEENKVVSTKGNDRISFVLESFEVEVVKDGQPCTVLLDWSVIEQNGSTYMAYYDMEKLFDDLIIIRNQPWTTSPVLDIYHTPTLIHTLLPDSTNLLQFLDANIAPNAFSNSIALSGAFNLNLEKIGISVKGDSNLKMEVKRQDDVLGASLELNGTGLYNLCRILQQVGLYNSSTILDSQLDLDEPVIVQFYMDKDAIYVQSDTVAPLLMFEDMPYSASTDDKDEVVELLQGKWLKYAFIDENRKTWQDFMNQLNGQMPAAQLLENAVNGIIYEYGYNGHEAVLNHIKLLNQMLSEQYLSVQDTSALQFHIQDDAVRAMMDEMGWWNALPEAYPWQAQERETKQALFNRSIFGLDFTAAHQQDGTITRQINGNYQLENLVDYWNLKFGTLHISVSGNSTLTPGPQEIAAPNQEECILYSELLEKKWQDYYNRH